MTDKRIYIADLEAYNNGILKGKWIDLPCDDIEEEIKDLGEEIAIHDSEGFQYKVGEYDSIDELNKMAEFEESLDDYDLIKYNFILWNNPGDFEYAQRAYEDVQLFEGNLKEAAENMVDEGLYGDIPEAIKYHIDYQSIANDLDASGYCEFEYEGKTYTCLAS